MQFHWQNHQAEEECRHFAISRIIHMEKTLSTCMTIHMLFVYFPYRMSGGHQTNEVMDSNYTRCCSLRFCIIMLLLHKESAGLQKPKHATGAPFCITSSSIVHILNPKGLPHSIFFVLQILTRCPLILKKRSHITV
jgi:hypothetical protein